MECPHCGLINPPEAQRCDCGYDFESGKVLDKIKLLDSESDDREKSEEVDTSEQRSYPILFVLGLAFGAPLGEALIGGSVGFTIGLVVGGGIGKALQSLVTSHREGGSNG